jgi:hypothetical protein
MNNKRKMKKKKSELRYMNQIGADKLYRNLRWPRGHLSEV